MRRTTTSYSNAAVLFAFLWATFPPRPCMCNDTDCDFNESYDEIVTVIVNEPVHVTKYKWCLDIPPRCPDNKREFRTVHRNITVTKTRKVKKCCNDQIQLYDDCVPKCAEDECPNIQCVPGTVDRCKCKSGYMGYLCRQKCDVGRWGLGCANACDKVCPDCDHRTGCCKTAAAGSSIFCGGGTGRLPVRQTAVVGHDNGTVRKANETAAVAAAVDHSSSARFRMPSTTVRLQTATWEPAAADLQANWTRTESVTAGTTANQSDQTKPNAAEAAWAPLEVTALKYDELVTKLIWIFSMTVVAIAMVFVIMFVVFFNCYVPSKPEDDAAAARNRWSLHNTDKVHETCFTTQNICHVPADRYTKTPTMYASTNDDLPIHPDIFCPVFSAPHYTGGSSLYDSPQPLYEILC